MRGWSTTVPTLSGCASRTEYFYILRPGFQSLNDRFQLINGRNFVSLPSMCILSTLYSTLQKSLKGTFAGSRGLPLSTPLVTIVASIEPKFVVQVSINKPIYSTAFGFSLSAIDKPTRNEELRKHGDRDNRTPSPYILGSMYEMYACRSGQIRRTRSRKLKFKRHIHP